MANSIKYFAIGAASVLILRIVLEIYNERKEIFYRPAAPKPWPTVQESSLTQ